LVGKTNHENHEKRNHERHENTKPRKPRNDADRVRQAVWFARSAGELRMAVNAR
jgi:hypothetical protein